MFILEVEILKIWKNDETTFKPDYHQIVKILFGAKSSDIIYGQKIQQKSRHFTTCSVRFEAESPDI